MEELILYCNHCGNTTGCSLLHQTSANSTAHVSTGKEHNFLYISNYYLTKCKTCSEVSLYTDCEFDKNVGVLQEASVCFPIVKKFGSEVPPAILETYQEALKVEMISYIAFAILIRRALELLCDDQKAAGRNLKGQLADLASKNIIPATLSQMGETLRILGNYSVHSTKYKIEMDEVTVMKDFFIALIEYVYIAPSKLERVRESIKKKEAE